MSVSKPVVAAALALLGFVASTASAGAPAPAGDAVKGKAVFARCAICHDLKPGVPKMGPSLYGVFGRKAGTVAGFNYSPAMKSAKITWSPTTLDSYVTSPTRLIPGNKMAFAGLTAPADRANLIAYLQGATK
ncbi:MAG: c-type cytochrome [Sphingomonas bacterium]